MKKIISIILLCVFTLGIIYSLYNIITWKIDTTNNKEIKEEIDKNITIIPSDIVDEAPTFIIDFDKLKEINSDTVAYLKVNNTSIDHVVVKTHDNSYYLNHNFSKKKSVSGWIFIDYNNKVDGNDKNLVIYGHNMKDGSMFGTLKNVLKKDWYTNKDNHNITLVTKEETYNYEVFSVYSIKKEDYYITTNFKSNLDFEKFINKLKSRSIYNFDVDVFDSDNILTLSSCTSSASSRIVLHARRVK